MDLCGLGVDLVRTLHRICVDFAWTFDKSPWTSMDIHGLKTEQISPFEHFVKGPWKSMENSQIPWSPRSPRGIGGGVLSTAKKATFFTWYGWDVVT